MDVNKNNRWTILSVVVGSAVALLVLLTGPILVGAYVEILGLSEQNAGLVFSAEMFGFTAGAIAMFMALSTSERRILIFAVTIMVVGNALSMVIDAPQLLAACRFLTGIGSGMLMTLTILVIGTMRNTDAVFGMWTVGQLLLGATGLIVFPSIITSLGLEAVFATIGILSATLFATRRHYSAEPATSQMSAAVQGRSVTAWIGLTCLAGIFVYYAGQAAVWVYLERLGVTWDLDPLMIARILFAALFAGIAGATIAVFLGNRAGRRVPVVASLTISAISIGLLYFQGDVARFAVAACLFNLGWYLFLPYSASVIASVDKDGKLLTGLGIVFPGSLAAGPAIAALLVSNGDLHGPLVVGLLSVPIGLFGMLPATRS
jgi:MFS family permease